MRNPPIKVLLISGSTTDAGVVRGMLDEAGDGRFLLRHADRLGEALHWLGEEAYDAILLDLSDQGAPGLKAITRLDERAPGSAIVVVNAVLDEALSLRAIQAGAQDYLVKWQGDGVLLSRSLHYAIEHKKEKERLVHMAQYDALTGLANRTLFRDQLSRAVKGVGRSGLPVALMFLDLDRFKIINDTLGHDVGDKLLKVVAQRLRGCVRTGDVIARLGGDEFTVIQERVQGLEQVEAAANKIIHVMAQPFVLGNQELFVGTSIGIATCPGNGKDVDTLLKNADTAMYHAKGHGGNNYVFYRPEMSLRAQRRIEMEGQLRHAVERDELQVLYQPQFDARSGMIVGAEALLRWRRPGFDHLLRPQEFIPLAEETGVVVPIGRWVIEAVCAEQQRWHSHGAPVIKVSVNLSSRQLRDQGLLEHIAGTLRRYDRAPEQLELELNESIVMESMKDGGTRLVQLRDLGLPICIDNFGSGASSLSTLKHLPIDTLKIDKSFVREITIDRSNAAIASAIIALAKNLGLGVIAEGVEREEQGQFLLQQGCTIVQGHYFSPPVTGDEFLGLVKANRRLRLVR